MIKKLLLVTVVVLAVVTIQAPSQASTYLFYESSPQSWVGQGQTRTIRPEDGFSFHHNVYFDNGAHFFIDNFDTVPFGSDEWWLLDFSAPNDAPLTTGLYPNATRWPFQPPNEPGMNFAGNGRGNNQLNGFFKVNQADYAPDGSFEHLSIDFTQYDEQIPEWWTKGELRYNASEGVVPEPATLMITGLGLVVMFVQRRRMSSS